MTRAALTLFAMTLAAATLPAVAQDVSDAVLFRNATVLTMSEAGVLAGHDVLIESRRIVRLAPTGDIEPPAGARIVDARGRFLMPGLAEMHAHVPAPPNEQYAHDVLLLYVAHGITTIRGMLGHPWHLELRADIAAGHVLGPRLYTSGPSLNGNSAPDADTARRMVREQQAAGYDFIKLHPGLKRDVFDAIVAAAREAGIPFSGHVSDDVGLAHALAARQSAIDHLDGYMQALAEERCLDGSVAAGFFGIGLTRCVDPDQLPLLVTATRLAGTWMAPTQVLLEQWALPPDEATLAARPAARYLPPAVLRQWADARSRFIGLQGLNRADAEAFVALRRRLIRELYAADVPILLASDAPQVFNVPGDSALMELAIYAESGLGNAGALATATVNPARFYGASGLFGQVREGLEADLVLLAGDPLEDIANVRRIEGVMLRGRWLDRAELDVRLAELEQRVKQ